MVDAVMAVIGLIGAVVMGALGILIGRLLDPMFRAKFRIMALRENIMALALVSKDKKTLKRLVLKPDNSRICVGETIIAIENDRIFREGKEEEGFFFNSKHIKFDEGVPTLYVYADSLKPVTFFEEPSRVSGEDVATVLIAFVRIEIMKGMEALKRYELLLIAILLFTLFCCAIAGYATYMSMNASATAAVNQAHLEKIMTHFRISINGTDELAVTNPKTTGSGSTIIITGS